jgi:isoleucyl-tRNA synthetase
MSKSLGNVIAPQEVIKRHGSDVLRLWVATIDFLDDMRLSPEILSRNAEAYRKIRNTCRFILGNLQDFDPARHAVHLKELQEIDLWVLHQLNRLITRAREAYERYEFHVATQAIHRFSTVTLSSLYLDIQKDCLYVSPPDAPARRSAQTAMRLILDAMIRLMAPILCFTAEEAWQALANRFDDAPLDSTVHAEEFPVPLDLTADDGLLENWDRLLEVREEVLKALEVVRAEKLIGNALEAQVTLEVPESLRDLLRRYEKALRFIFIVSGVDLGPVAEPTYESVQIPGLRIAVARASGVKCERCWNVTTDTGEDDAYKTLCARCAGAVRTILASRGSEA